MRQQGYFFGKNFEKREKVIEEILMNVLKKKQTSVKILYNEEKEEYKRLKIEATAYLKECGITAIFD